MLHCCARCGEHLQAAPGPPPLAARTRGVSPQAVKLQPRTERCRAERGAVPVAGAPVQTKPQGRAGGCLTACELQLCKRAEQGRGSCPVAVQPPSSLAVLFC